MGRFFKKIGKGLGGIVKKALPYAVGGVVGGALWHKRGAIAGAIAKGADWIRNRVEDLISKGKTPAEAEGQAVEESKKQGGFPWLIVGLAGGAVMVVIIIIVIISSGRKR